MTTARSRSISGMRRDDGAALTVGIAFDQAPPITVPLRFFLTAPVFGCFAGVLIAWSGGDFLASRWSGTALALTHLVTLGFMLQAMCGALLQVLPVAVGANVWRPRVVGWLTHVGLVAGTLLLVAGFLLGGEQAFRWAMPILVATVAGFLGAVGMALARTSAVGPTVTVLRFSVAALALTISLGATLALGFGWNVPLPALRITELHAVWGVLGWGLLLVVAVAFLVVPMFQLTPPYRKGFARLFPLVLVGALVAWSIAAAFGEPLPLLREGATLVLALAVAGFAAETLYVQNRRRRRHQDVSFLFWRTGMLALLAAVLFGVALLASRDAVVSSRLELALGLAMLVGFFVSVINGMFYKIVPFLVWLHLQRRVSRPPNMNQVIGEDRMRGQLWLHWSALAALGSGLIFPPLLIVGGLLFAASCAWVEINLAHACRIYWRISRDAGSAL